MRRLEELLKIVEAHGFLYHGTTDKNAAKILRGGLRADKIWTVTDSLLVAWAYARARYQQLGGNPVVLRIKLSEKDKDIYLARGMFLLSPFRDEFGEREKHTQYEVKKTIPPDRIEKETVVV